ncbi:two-component sensor histidine kinase [Ferrigenium kumadai]|uniref:histidine kinase n=1 Tax=Ferrigenium kumadai TaxID=1682490 RepID=A0AAN1T041_9PROT|nr:ATP-binding protein [Ferrigenium kumadai]BBJ00258.1 two-component sensor histidine kinase [Ferrigenium kumadai]
MNSTILSSLPGHSQLRRLVALRGMAVAAQLLTLAAVWKILELELDWQPMLLTVATLTGINLLTWLRLRSSKPVSNSELFAQLCVDVLALTILLYYGGGSTNPFVSLYLLPLVIAAATLPARYTWGMAAITAACYSVLMLYYIPLPHNHHHDSDSAFNAHVMGMWFGFVISAVVVAYFVVQMAQAVRNRDEALVRVREEILRNERIVALGTQAAGAAHELGTPLSTMSVVIGELQHDATAQPEWHDALTILDEQVRGCKRILDKILANAQDSGAAVLLPADKLVAEVLDEWQLLRPTAQYRYRNSDAQPAPLVSADATLRAALMNLLNNAADAAPQSIDIETHWDANRFMLEIHDHGKGLSEEAGLKAGSAFFTTKSEGRGLGLFLANATVERLGGTVRLFNRDTGGATTQLILPLAGAQS